MSATNRLPDDYANILSMFQDRLPRGARQPAPWEIANLGYLLELIRNSPTHITHAGRGAPYAQMVAAVCVLQDVLPGLIADATAAAAEARAAGRTTDMDVFALRATALLGATRPFKPVLKKRDPRSYWHGWACLLRQTVGPLLDRDGGGFGGPKTMGTLIVMDLLSLAGITVEPDTLVKALR